MVAQTRDPSDTGLTTVPRVSVLLAVRNGEPFLRYQLLALERQACSFAWEVIIIDNGSTDGSAATARTFVDRLPHFTLLYENTPGKSYALNLGISAARGKYLIIADADDEAAEDYLQRMSEGLDTYDVVGGYLETKLLNAPVAQNPSITNTEMPVFLGFLPAIPGCTLGIRASVLDKVGLFDVNLKLGEDIDVCWRAHALGATFGRQLDAVLHNRRPATNWEAFKKARGYSHAYVWLYERYRSQGLKRRSLHDALAPLRWAIALAVRHDEPWQWGLAWEIGALTGRIEESIRRGVYFP